MSLPYKKKLVYIESDGNQFVDTGVMVSSETFERAEMDIAVVRATYSAFYIGTRWTNVDLCVANDNFSNVFAIGRFSSGYATNSYVLGERTNIVFDRTGVTVNGSTTALAITETSNASFKIFATDATSFRSSMRFYSAKVVCGGETILDLIPVLDMNDVPCIYNKVNGALYYNKGTGQFTYEYNLQVLTSIAVATRFNPLGRKLGKLTAKDYIQNGLLFHYDGIENIGYGQHDSNATYWKDLVSGNDLVVSSGATAPKWNDFAFCGETNVDHTLYSTSRLGSDSNGTIEIVAYSANRINNEWLISNRDGGGSDNFIQAYASSTDLRLVSSGARSQQAFIGLVEKDVLYASIAMDSSSARMYLNGELIGEVNDNFTKAIFNNTFLDVGSIKRWHGQKYYMRTGTYLAEIRISNRALASAEIKNNFEIDKVRFSPFFESLIG